MTNASSRFFIVTKKAQLSCYSSQRDRDFFSVPVEVNPVYTSVQTRVLHVQSPLQGGITYPVKAGWLRLGRVLTQEQRATARLIGE